MPAQGDKPVKKVEVEDEEDNKSLSFYRKKSVNGSAESRSKVAKVKKEVPIKDGDDIRGSSNKFEKKEVVDGSEESRSKVAKVSSNKVKKEEEVDDDEEDERTLSVSLKEKKKKSMNGSLSQGKVKKEEAKVDKKKKKIKMKVEEERKVKKERKVFDLPGQKRDPPEERDPLRIFYETLYEQLPSSEMAAFWMMESGLLPLHEAKKVYEKKLKRSQEQKLRSPVIASPVKAIASVKKTVNSVTVKKVKAASSLASSAKKMSVVESKTVRVSVSKKSNKRKNRHDNSDTSEENESDDDFVLSKKKISKKPRAA